MMYLIRPLTFNSDSTHMIMNSDLNQSDQLMPLP